MQLLSELDKASAASQCNATRSQKSHDLVHPCGAGHLLEGSCNCIWADARLQGTLDRSKRHPMAVQSHSGHVKRRSPQNLFLGLP